MAALLLLLTACSSGGQVMDGEDMVRSYTQISQDEAKQMMEQDGTQIIVDVRTQEEYELPGHLYPEREHWDRAAEGTPGPRPGHPYLLPEREPQQAGGPEAF